MIDLRLSPAVESLRADFVRWIGSNSPPEISPRLGLDEFVRISGEWQNRLAAEQWIGVHWPEAWGGRGLSIVEEAVIQGELARARAPQLVGLFGLTMVGPVLIKHGTEEQRTRFLRRILSAEDIWCQGFSEPQAGSDLAALGTSAVRGDDRWILNGQKIWTSFAQYASWCFLLARSDSQAAKHRGISYFLVDLKSEGVDVRPLRQISGDAEFNEVFLENVEVPGEDLVGAPGAGWEIAISTLMHERVVLTLSRHLQSEQALEEIRVILANEGTAHSDTEKLGELTARSMGVRALALSHLVTYGPDREPGPEGSLDKLGWSETFQDICRFGFDVLGTRGVLTSGLESFANGLFPHLYLYSRGRTIAAGTSEIQRNIIAERYLGLPRG